jgi:hypothetical protein
LRRAQPAEVHSYAVQFTLPTLCATNGFEKMAQKYMREPKNESSPPATSLCARTCTTGFRDDMVKITCAIFARRYVKR